MPITKPRLSTNINTDVGTFTDPILVLHQGATVADVDVGFLMNRSNGLTSNAAVIWQESSKSFVHLLTNSSGAADANLVVQTYANVTVGNVLLINNSGIYVDGTLGSAGQVLASDGSKSYWATSLFTGGVVSNVTIFESNTIISNTTSSTSNVTGALVVLGGAGIGGNVYTQKLYTTDGLFWAGNGNVIVTGGGGGPGYGNIYTPNNDQFSNAASATSQINFVGANGIEVLANGNVIPNTITFRVTPGLTGLSVDYGFIIDPVVDSIDYGSLV